MTIVRPTVQDIQSTADALGITLSKVDALSYAALMVDTFATYDELDCIPDELPQSAYPRGVVRIPPSEDNPCNAWAVTTEIRGASSGKLAGRTIALKDNVCVAGVPMSNGASILRGYIPEIDATIVRRILDAGGVIKGKARCEYFCASAASFTSDGGPVLNPHNPSHSAGGSSSGSAALVAMGAVDLAVGGDQGGSIRIPAAACGVVGLKPSYGLVPYTGIMGGDVSLDHTGPITRNVADNALFLEVLAGSDGIDPRQSIPPGHNHDYTSVLADGVAGLKIGLLTEGFTMPEADPAVSERVRSAALLLQEHGAEVGNVSVPLHAYGSKIWLPVILEGTLASMLGNGVGPSGKGLYLPSLIDRMNDWHHRADEMSEVLKVLLVAGKWVVGQRNCRGYAKAQNLGRRLKAAYNEALAAYDVLFLPTMPRLPDALPLREASREEEFDKAVSAVPNAAPFNLTGHPALSMPCAVIDGLPVGGMFVGAYLDEKTIYRVAYILEQALARRTAS